MNSGGLCAKGAGSIQLVNNTSAHRCVGRLLTPSTRCSRPMAPANGVAYKRTGNGAWSAMGLQAAIGEIATGMVAARGTLTDAAGYNSKGVAFLGLLAHEQRAELHLSQDDCELRHEQHRASGPYLTLVHGGRSGRRIRTRRDDEPLGRHGELDERRRHGALTRSRTTPRRSRTSTVPVRASRGIRRRT